MFIHRMIVLEISCNSMNLEILLRHQHHYLQWVFVSLLRWISSDAYSPQSLGSKYPRIRVMVSSFYPSLCGFPIFLCSINHKVTIFVRFWCNWYVLYLPLKRGCGLKCLIRLVLVQLMTLMEYYSSTTVFPNKL